MFSCAAGREEYCRQSHWRAGALAVCGPHWVCPAHACALSRSTLLRLQVALPGTVEGGPLVHALPRAKSPRFRFSGPPHGCRRGWACAVCPSQVRAAQATRCLASAHSPGGRCILSPPGPSPSVSWVQGVSADSGVRCVSSGELISDCDPPGGCQPSRIPERLG